MQRRCGQHPADIVIESCRSAGLGRTRLCHPWGREPEGGVVGRLRYVSHVVGPRQGLGFEGLGWSRWVPSRSWMVPYRSVYQSYTDTGQSSHPSGLVGVRRAMSGFRRVSVGTLFWHDGTRRGSTDRSTVPYPCTIESMYGPPGHATASSRGFWGPVGTQRTPIGPPAAPSDPV